MFATDGLWAEYKGLEGADFRFSSQGMEFVLTEREVVEIGAAPTGWFDFKRPLGEYLTVGTQYSMDIGRSTSNRLRKQAVDTGAGNFIAKYRWAQRP